MFPKYLLFLGLLGLAVSCQRKNEILIPIDLIPSDSTKVIIAKGFEELLIEKGYIIDNVNDGLVEYGQIKDIDTLKIDSDLWDHYRFTSLRGIEYFPKLRYLNMFGSYVDTVDLSKNIELTYLNCGGLFGGGGPVATIKFLNVKNCINLKYLNCSRHVIKTLDLSRNGELEELYCGSNDLTKLDLSNNPRLRILDTYANRGIEDLDLSKNPLLEKLDVGYNTLAELKIEYLVNLKKLDCSYNYSDFKPTFNKLDISKNAQLVTLDIAGSRLTEIDLRHNPRIESLNITSCNSLSNIDISILSELKSFGCSYSLLKEIKLNYNEKLEFLDISGTLFSEIDLSKNTKLKQLVCRFQNYLTKLDLSNLRELERCSTYKCPNLEIVCLNKLPEANSPDWVKDDSTEYKVCE